MRRQALEKRRAMLVHQPGIKTLRRAVVSSLGDLGSTLVQLTRHDSDPVQRVRLWHEARAVYDEGLRASAGLDWRAPRAR